MPSPTRRDRGTSRPARVATALVAAALALGAAPARAQFAGVPTPPPRPATPAAAVAAARPKSDSVSRLRRERDSLSTVQRLDIQAWVDSAAPALARQPAASRDSVRRPPAATPPARRPERTSARPPGRRPGLTGEGAVERRLASVADRRGRWYLRPWPCPATHSAAPSRSV